MELNKFDAELDEYYVSQIGRLLLEIELSERKIKIYEDRRKSLRRREK